MSAAQKDLKTSSTKVQFGLNLTPDQAGTGLPDTADAGARPGRCGAGKHQLLILY